MILVTTLFAICSLQRQHRWRFSSLQSTLRAAMILATVTAASSTWLDVIQSVCEYKKHVNLKNVEKVRWHIQDYSRHQYLKKNIQKIQINLFSENNEHEFKEVISHQDYIYLVFIIWYFLKLDLEESRTFSTQFKFNLIFCIHVSFVCRCVPFII